MENKENTKMDKLKVIYEDNQIIVVEKMANVPTQSDKTGDKDMLTIVKEYIKAKYNKPGNVYLGLVHRLDRPVGGVMVFARTSKAASRLSEQVRNKTFSKNYLAIVSGEMNPKNGKLEDYLWKDEKKNTSYVVREGKKNAKLAALNYETLKFFKDENLSVLKIKLETGRHHQIRVQLSNKMHAIYGDVKYHGRSSKDFLYLWAYKLSFEHPVTKEMLTFTCLPESKGKWELLKQIDNL